MPTLHHRRPSPKAQKRHAGAVQPAQTESLQHAHEYPERLFLVMIHLQQAPAHEVHALHKTATTRTPMDELRLAGWVPFYRANAGGFGAIKGGAINAMSTIDDRGKRGAGGGGEYQKFSRLFGQARHGLQQPAQGNITVSITRLCTLSKHETFFRISNRYTPPPKKKNHPGG